MILLLNSTKTMNTQLPFSRTPRTTKPRQIDHAEKLASLLRPMSEARLAKLMGLSGKLATETKAAAALWGEKGQPEAPAFTAFTGLVTL